MQSLPDTATRAREGARSDTSTITYGSLLHLHVPCSLVTHHRCALMLAGQFLLEIAAVSPMVSSRCCRYGGTPYAIRSEVSFRSVTYIYTYFYDKVDRMAKKREFLIHLLIKWLSQLRSCSLSDNGSLILICIFIFFTPHESQLQEHNLVFTRDLL